jgi:hypothetical protein
MVCDNDDPVSCYAHSLCIPLPYSTLSLSLCAHISRVIAAERSEKGQLAIFLERKVANSFVYAKNTQIALRKSSILFCSLSWPIYFITLALSLSLSVLGK